MSLQPETQRDSREQTDAPIGLHNEGSLEAAVRWDVGPLFKQVDEGGDLVGHADAKPIEGKGRGRQGGRSEGEREQHRFWNGWWLGSERATHAGPLLPSISRRVGRGRCE